MKKFLSEDGKWEAPNENRRLWRRKTKDGHYEYSEKPPQDQGSSSQEENKDQGKVTQETGNSTVEQTGNKQEEPKVMSADLVPKTIPKIPRENHIQLNKAQLKELLTKGHFSVISGGRNPNDAKEEGMSPDDEVFHRRHELLRGDLEKSGLKYTETAGHYGGKENSFMVFHDDTELTPKTQKSLMVHYNKDSADKARKFLNELGTKYNQDSVLHAGEGKNSLSYTTGKRKGEECYGEGWSETPEAEDFYTDIELEGKEHTKFKLDLSDCEKRGFFGSERRFRAKMDIGFRVFTASLADRIRIGAGKELHVYDFDYTLAAAKKGIRITHDDGSVSVVEHGSQAKPGEKVDFSGLSDVTNARKVKGVFDEFKKRASDKNNKVVILTARPHGAVSSIGKFLKNEGIDGVEVVALGSGNPQHKADWIEGEVKKNGFDTVSFTDDTVENVNAVEWLRSKLPNVKLTTVNPKHPGEEDLESGEGVSFKSDNPTSSVVIAPQKKEKASPVQKTHGTSDWWNSQTPEFQKEYLKSHPDSQYK